LVSHGRQDNSLRINLVKEPEGLVKIKGAWHALCRDLGNSITPFASFEWYETWWRHYSAGETLNLIALWEADRLVGIAPLMLRNASIHGLPATVVCFIENNQTPHNDFIVLPAFRECFMPEVMNFLFKQIKANTWDVLVFNKLPVTSANYCSLIKHLGEAGMRWRQEQTLDSPYLVPSGNWTEYLASRSNRTRKSLRNIQNNMQKAGEFSVRNIRTWEEFQLVREDVYNVARQSWTEQHGDSIASLPNAGFFDDLARCAAAMGWLSLWTLSLNGKVIAIEFHLQAHGKEHAMRGHFLPEFASLSPGTFLEMQILKHVHEEANRVERYELGNFYDYMRKWTDDSVPYMAVSVFNDRFYSRFLAFHEFISVPMLGRIFPPKFWSHELFKKVGINTKRLNIKQH